MVGETVVLDLEEDIVMVVGVVEDRITSKQTKGSVWMMVGVRSKAAATRTIMMNRGVDMMKDTTITTGMMEEDVEVVGVEELEAVVVEDEDEDTRARVIKLLERKHRQMARIQPQKLPQLIHRHSLLPLLVVVEGTEDVVEEEAVAGVVVVPTGRKSRQ